MNRLPLAMQLAALKSYFPNGIGKLNKNIELCWAQNVTPSPLSNKYTLVIKYNINDVLKVYVANPQPLKLAEGATKLPHVYSTRSQRLCLYYPTEREWKPSMYLTKTIIPWACEWLLHYEIWLVTGKWCGGGIEHESEVEKEKALKKVK